MFTNVSQQLGIVIENKTFTFINRTGGTLTKGAVVAVDLTGSDGDVQPIASWNPSTHGDTAHPLANVITPATAHLNGWFFAVCLEDSLADNELGQFGVEGIFDVRVAAGDGTDPAIAIGGLGVATNGQTYLSAGADGVANIAQLLEAGPTAAEVGLAKAIFQGWPINTHGG